MNDDEYEVTIGTGGWALVVLSGMITFAALRWGMQFLLFPSVVFAIAIALTVSLLLYALAGKVSREEETTTQRVRKIVPASAEVRLDGGMAPAVKAVPVRAEALKSQRSSSVVTPLSEVEPAPIIAAPVAAPVIAEVVDVAEVVAPAPKAKAAKPKAAKPKAAKAPKAEKAEGKPKVAKTAKSKAAKPASLVRLDAPRQGVADDLKEIEGIGPALEKLVNSLGFYHYDQIAAWTEADVAAVDAEMKTFKGRIARDKWVEQARIIVTEGLEAFRGRARTNEY